MKVENRLYSFLVILLNVNGIFYDCKSGNKVRVEGRYSCYKAFFID
jgi:hypothetical protein